MAIGAVRPKYHEVPTLKGEFAIPKLGQLVAEKTLATRTNIVYACRDERVVRGKRRLDIVPVTEAQALRQLHRTLGSISTFLGASTDPADRSLAAQGRRMQTQLGILGTPESELAANAIAMSLAQRIRRNPDKHLLVGVRPDESSIHILHKVRQQPPLASTEYSTRIHPFNTASANSDYRQHIYHQAEGQQVILLDDWIISGEQMALTNERLEGQYGIPKSQQIITLMSAPKIALKSGLYDVEVQSYFRHANAAKEYERTVPTLTGLHSMVDYGFGALLDDMFIAAQGRTRTRFRAQPYLASTIRPHCMPETAQYYQSAINRLPAPDRDAIQRYMAGTQHLGSSLE